MRRFLLLLIVIAPIFPAISPAVSPQTSSGSIPQHHPDLSPALSQKTKCADVRFSGEVTRDRRYDHPLPRNLEFRLVPYPEGWSIFIGRPGNRSDDYVGIATPPYHGVNPVIIEAWHFRNADNTGPNEGQVNAPTDVRDFSFVMNEAQYAKFTDALDVWSGKPGATAKQIDDATRFLLDAPRRSGTLTIVDMKLGGLEKGTHPWFESMKFNVDLCFPPPAAPHVDKNAPAQTQPPKKIASPVFLYFK